MSRVMVPLNERERGALWRLAEIEKRDFRQQAALIIRAELERIGLLEQEPLPTPKAPIASPSHNESKEYAAAN